ncbi:aldo/keto reductase [Streptomyces chiangmaiensis]|uniref:Aldo/keto reductase n=1 Tax=Streptomyces chiangmaiensis TaxID=766497 RepID=A0ABU7FND0_9ACTN|nr:aldo/keto reductase [Streptomyces chiangmaiensis]MED7825569.1 aldo/keto reductase [Streptomyces chiangmaiensis]
MKSWSPTGGGRRPAQRGCSKGGRKEVRTPTQVLLHWHVQQGLVVVPKSSNSQRVRENLDIFDFELDCEDLATLAELDHGETGVDSGEVGR